MPGGNRPSLTPFSQAARETGTRSRTLERRNKIFEGGLVRFFMGISITEKIPRPCNYIRHASSRLSWPDVAAILRVLCARVTIKAFWGPDG